MIRPYPTLLAGGIATVISIVAAPWVLELLGVHHWSRTPFVAPARFVLAAVPPLVAMAAIFVAWLFKVLRKAEVGILFALAAGIAAVRFTASWVAGTVVASALFLFAAIDRREREEA